MHSSFDIRIGDLEESFPFDQHETTNDTDTTAVRRKGGPYEWVSRASAPRTCPSSAPYYALARSDGNWHCFKKVGEGKGRYDIYTDQPQYYPGSAGKPDQTPDSDDVLTITKTTSDQTITVNGIPYRLVLYGFVPNADGNCPATPPAGSTPVSTFTTKESQASFGCLYGSFSQERYVRVAKAVTEDSEQVGDAIPPFTFTTMGVGDWAAPTGTPLTTSVPADGFVDWKSFEDANLTPTAYGEAGAVSSGYRAFMPGFSQFIIAETGPRIAGRFPLDFGAQGRFGPWKTNDDPNSAQWSLVDVTCLNGVGERVNVTRDPDTGGVDFSQVARPRPPRPADHLHLHQPRAGPQTAHPEGPRIGRGRDDGRHHRHLPHHGHQRRHPRGHDRAPHGRAELRAGPDRALRGRRDQHRRARRRDRAGCRRVLRPHRGRDRRAGRLRHVVHPHLSRARHCGRRVLRGAARVRLVERAPHPGARPLQLGDGRLRPRRRGQQRGLRPRAPPPHPRREGRNTAGRHAQRRRHVPAGRRGLRDLRQTRPWPAPRSPSSMAGRDL